VADYVRRWRERIPGAVAFGSEDACMSWEQYDVLSDQLAGVPVQCGLDRGSRVAVMLPDGPEVHAVWLGAGKAALIAVGIGARAGDREIAHLVRKATRRRSSPGRCCAGDRPATWSPRSPRGGLSPRYIRLREIAADGWSSVTVDGVPVTPPGSSPPELARRRLGPSEIFMINSMSGTTGLA
jgi:acyl-CoA synthetase